MNTHHPLLERLNEQQLEAVTAPPGHILILAGAGSGKTDTLTRRIGWLMTELNVSPRSILAVTFTNKAAREMKNRIELLIGYALPAMWVGTFHGLAHRFLRSHWQEANLPQSFQILDSDDQLRIIRKILKTMNLDEDRWPAKQSQWFISNCKEQGKRPKDVHGHDYFTETQEKIYTEYQTLCSSAGLVDFSELLLLTLETLQANPDLLEHYQQSFKHILVDEFQDTNTIQYTWLKMLAGTRAYMMAVGDDDQSIYSWRGAKIENIHRFSKDFPNSKIIRLEQNYRSTQMILNAANAVIEKNESRMGKRLWTEGHSGEAATVYRAFNEHDEADYIVSVIREWARQPNHSYQDIAILYRSNAQSRVLEEHLISGQIPYRIYGGLKFFDRAEIKDTLAYLRLLLNRHDDASIERIINLPTRGIGQTTLNALRMLAKEQHCSLWQSALHHIQHKLLSARASNALQVFIDLINRLEEETQTLTLEGQCEYVLQKSGLREHFSQSNAKTDLARIENLDELISAMMQFQPDPNFADLPPLHAFLAHAALEAGETQAAEHSDCVYLMTLHAAKGLEFPMVIMAGMEEYLFPHRMSIEDPKGLEEERRLCYVGMTRARQKLYFTFAEYRRLYGIEKANIPSRFLSEIPEDCLQEVRGRLKTMRPTLASTSSFKRATAQPAPFQIGQRLRHPTFGVGVLVNFEGSGEQIRVQIKFERHGTKWLILNMAKLEVC
jgi:DNA helicase-2/ATP-dependent DNA helicase PcrA